MKALKKATSVIFALIIFIVLSIRVSAEFSGKYARGNEAADSFEKGGEIESILINSMPERTEYLALSSFDSRGLSLTVTYKSGEVEVVGEEELLISCPRGELLYYGDSSVSVSYKGQEIKVPVTVKRRDYDLSQIVLDSKVLTYDGEYHALEPRGDMPIGLDGIELKYTVLSPKCDVGTYRQTVIFTTESAEYNTPPPIYASLHILPQEIEVLWSDEPLVYDGTKKAPTAKAYDLNGAPVEITVFGGKVGAGEGYVATAICTSDNYTVKNPYKSFQIQKADYDMSGAHWVVEDFTYDGNEKRVYIEGLPQGVGVSRYIGAVAHEGGEYAASVILSYDTVNYNEPMIPICKWQIFPASYDMSGVKFADSEFIYDGCVHYPRLVGRLPIGLDGSVPKYSFSEGAAHVSDGMVWVEITFESQSRNYISPPPMTAAVSILPKSITVAWGNADFVYDGSPKAPFAISDECEIYISGMATNAGEYIAYAAPSSSDFLIQNPELAYRIAKAQNALVGAIEIFDIYASGTPQPNAKLIHGVPLFRYFADEACTEELSLPLPVGRVYVKAYAEESENYLAYESPVASFAVMPVLPIGIAVEDFSADYLAYQRVSENAGKLFLCFNDGTRKSIPFKNASVAYERGDSFRYGDSFVRISYGGFECDVEVRVMRAEYDLSSAFWSENLFVFDGAEKSLYLSALPEGVSVLYYENNGMVSAGEYEVIAHLSYDTENYNPPKNPTCKLVIKKQPVPVPERVSAEFCGAYQSATVAQSPLYTVESPTVKDCGVYKLTLSLRDPENYEWDGVSGERITVDFEISPCEISIELPSITVYLFESLPEDSQIYAESPIDGEMILVTLKAVGNAVIAASSDPNYHVKVLGGEIVHRYIPSPEALRIIALVLLLLLLLVLFVFAIRKYGKRLLYHARKRRRAPIVLLTSEKGESEKTPTPVSENSPLIDRNSPQTPPNDGEIEKTILGMDESRADELISDALAKNLLRRDDEVIETYGRRKSVINVDTLSCNFSSGDKVDVNLLKRKSLIPFDTGYIKVLARGVIDKPLRIYANDFSLSAVKMIALTGGEAVRCLTVKSGKRRKKNT